MPWQPPAKLPTIHDLRDAIARCDLTLDGRVSSAVARICFAKLVMAFEAGSKLSGEETKLRIAVWLEACGDLNDALWTDATSQAIQTMKWMPKPAEFRALVSPQLDKARKRKERLRKMLELSGKPVEKPFVREPYEVRLKAMRDSYKKHGYARKAAEYERSLAYDEKRPVEAWALEPVTEPTAPAGLAPAELPKPSLETRIALTKAAMKFHKDMGFADIVAMKERELAQMERELALAEAELELASDTRSKGTQRGAG